MPRGPKKEVDPAEEALRRRLPKTDVVGPPTNTGAEDRH